MEKGKFAVPWIRVPHAKAVRAMEGAYVRDGLSRPRARLLARILAGNSLEGVPSHGLHFFSYFHKGFRDGRIETGIPARKTGGCGAWEEWDGGQGPGPLNAWASTQRAMVLARKYGIGLVALRHTSHWTRAGSYGHLAAKAGFGLICWTNTPKVMPYWGGRKLALGNNPLVLAFPQKGEPLVLDAALSQYSMGRLKTTQLRGKLLPLPGGYDSQGRLSLDPGAILKTGRHLPIGFWKGSGLALILDLLAASLAGGNSTASWYKTKGRDDVSQVYIAFNLTGRRGSAGLRKLLALSLKDLKASMPRGFLHLPGAGAAKQRRENLARGIPVTAQAWKQILEASEASSR